MVLYHVFLDFDSTITYHDTLDHLGRFGSQHSHTEQFWELLSRTYNQKYATYTATHISETLEAPKIKLEDILSGLNGLRPIELDSIRMTNRHGIFNGLADYDLFGAGKEAVNRGDIKIRDGFFDFIDALKTFEETGGPLATVLSVNWSDEWIKGCIHPAKLPVVSNTVLGNWVCGPGLASENEERDGLILVSRDKARAVSNLAHQRMRLGDEIVYIGDSLTDLECVLIAAHSIVMVEDKDTSKLYRVLTKLGNKVPHVSECDTDFKYAWAMSFSEILESTGLSDIHGLRSSASGVVDNASPT